MRRKEAVMTVILVTLAKAILIVLYLYGRELIAEIREGR